MKSILMLALATLAAGCAPQEPVEMSDADQSRLAEALAGREPGPSQSCVSNRDVRNSRVVGDAVIYEGPGTMVYLNRTSGGCNTQAGRSLVSSNPTGNLCRGDIVRSVDPVSGTDWGSCTLGDFVPYRRMR